MMPETKIELPIMIPSQWTAISSQGFTTNLFCDQCYTIKRTENGDALNSCVCNGKCEQYIDELIKVRTVMQWILERVREKYSNDNKLFLYTSLALDANWQNLLEILSENKPLEESMNQEDRETVK